MVANRLKGIRCVVCWNAESARLARQHNDANMISLGQRMMTKEQAAGNCLLLHSTPALEAPHIDAVT